MTPDNNDICTSAPGKLMLFGEHAVLYGYPCIVAAVTPRAHVRLHPRTDHHITIVSELGEYKTVVKDLIVEEPFTFVLEAIRRANVTSGFDLSIHCDFPADVGLGSSAAVTVATMGALLRGTTGEIPDHETVFSHALDVVRTIQGTGSGADLAAATFGGLLYLRSGGEQLKQLDCTPQLGAIYSGSKEKTTVVVGKVKEALASDPRRYNQLFEHIGQVVDKAKVAFEESQWEEIGRLMAENQSLMAQMGVSNDTLESIIHRLVVMPGVYGAKISGSGLGDCVWYLGNVEPDHEISPLDLALDTDGLCFH